MEIGNLCDVCSCLDLSPLVALPKAKRGSRKSTREYEDDFAVYLDFSLERASESHECPLCSLITECATRTGQLSWLRNAYCCLRPKFLWSSEPRSRSGRGTKKRMKLRHAGQIHVWFYENKTYPKSVYPTPPEAGDSAGSEGEASSSGQEGSAVEHTSRFSPISYLTTIQSSMASWMIDIVVKCRAVPSSNRYPIPASIDAAILREWLQNCDNYHHHHSNSSKFSTGLRHIINRGLLRGINTSSGAIELLPSQTPFAVLSYVWGHTVDQQESLQAMKVSRYARTIRDAAELAKSIGLEWLWVDRICINQNSEAEKSALIPYIKDIFAGAELTIVAASGDGAHYGLPGSYNTARVPEIVAEIPIWEAKALDPFVLRLLPATSSFNALHEKTVWRTRGWTFQEQVFSRRLLYIFPSEMIFSCSKGTYRESAGTYFDPKPAGTVWGDSGATMPLIASELWANFNGTPTEVGNIMSARQFVRAVEEYTSRNLTIEADRVAAFAGLVTAATDPDVEIPEQALLQHGHPLRFFETALSWRHEEGFQGRHTQGKCLVPSWSWASAGTKVHFLDNGEEGSRSNWFRFGIVNGFDVLGLPACNFLSSKLGLSFPTELLNSSPWLQYTPSRAPPGYAPTPPVQATSFNPENLPQLHLVTVLFDGYWSCDSDGLHSIFDPPACLDAANPSSIRRPFAVVAGRWSFHIMALQETSEWKVFSRLGLLRVSENVDLSFFTIMKLGYPRWDYIRII
ncbi:heterokaryon incompatibility protein-domain-containing protein [Xylaria curta]|nr:heterokaryon incompatibility protein-domain-containing protein [Xylaria curta]